MPLWRRLARAHGRTDVTAMPAGPSVPHMFIVVLLIMLPVYVRTQDPILAWQAGLAQLYRGVRRGDRRVRGALDQARHAARLLLGTLAGISIAFISMQPAMQIADHPPWIGLVSFAIVIGGWMAGVRSFRVPAGLLAILVGTAIGWVTGIMDAGASPETVRQFSIGLPRPAVAEVFAGFADIAPSWSPPSLWHL